MEKPGGSRNWKKTFLSTVILEQPNPNKTFIFQTDYSDFAIKGHLITK